MLKRASERKKHLYIVGPPLQSFAMTVVEVLAYGASRN